MKVKIKNIKNDRSEVMRISLVILLFLMLSNLLFSTDSTIISINDNEMIENVTGSNKYINVLTSIKENHTYSLKTYDTKGNILFSLQNLKNRISFAETLDESNSLVYIVSEGSDLKVGGNLDEVRSFNLQTGQYNWSISSYANVYEISPDRKHLITKTMPLGGDAQGPFEVIDLADGSKLIQKQFKYVYAATWYDSNNVLFAFQEYTKEANPEYAKYKKMKDEQRDLIHERQKIAIKFRRGDISKEDYLTQKQKLDKQIEKLQRKMHPKSESSQTTRTENGRAISTRKKSTTPRKENTIILPAKLSIFNIITGAFESETSVFGLNGDPIYWNNIYVPEIISVDKDKNILFRAAKRKKGYDSYLMRFNKNLGFEKEYHINHPHRFHKIKFNNNLLFVLKQKNSFTFLNTSLQKIDQNQARSQGLIPENINISNNFKRSLIVFYTGIEIDRENGVITVLDSEGSE